MRNDTFKKDLFRYYGEKGETLFDRLLRPMELKYLYVLRRLQSDPSILAKLYYKVRLRQRSKRTQIQIPAKARIGEGFYIGHRGRIIINPNAVLGKNINIATGVTIGQEIRGSRKGAPTIGDKCWIGTNAVIVGKITIGNDVLIAPLSFVNTDVPDHSVVTGNPARIIPKEYATDRYIEHTV